MLLGQVLGRAPFSQQSDSENTLYGHYFTFPCNKEIQHAGTIRTEQRGRKSQNGGRGSPGNTLDWRQKGESPLGNTLGRRREEKEEGGMKGIGVKFQLQKDDFCDGQMRPDIN